MIVRSRLSQFLLFHLPSLCMLLFITFIFASFSVIGGKVLRRSLGFGFAGGTGSIIGRISYLVSSDDCKKE